MRLVREVWLSMLKTVSTASVARLSVRRNIYNGPFLKEEEDPNIPLCSRQNNKNCELNIILVL
jgi:hypothetical protein